MTLHEFSYIHEDLVIKLNSESEQKPSILGSSKNAAKSERISKTISSDVNSLINSKDQDNRTESKSKLTNKDKDCDGYAPGFDETLKTLWDEARTKGLFRYALHDLPFKILPGKYQFIAQLNPDRAAKRRKPQRIQSPNEVFNPDEFNFNKAKEEEFLMKWSPWWSSKIQHDIVCSTGEISTSHLCLNDDVGVDEETCAKPDGKEIEHFVLINVSPLEYGHVLLTPFLKQNQPQKITFDGLRMAAEMVLLNSSRDFRVGFNSLCGYASVNHHHYHAYYLKHRLYMEYAELHCVMGPCREIRNYPAPGFAFVLQQLDIQSLENYIRNAFKLVSYLQQTNVAHNIFITRGSSHNSPNTFDALRLFIWARESSFGTKECEAFNPALCELGGHFPIKNELSYETLTEEYVSLELERICRETFTNVRQAAVSLYEDDDVRDFPNQSTVK